jgi:hypothetical protein
MRVRGGQNLYGLSVGVLLLDTRFPRIPGDMGPTGPFDPADLEAATGLPVFHVTTLVRMAHDAVRHGLAPRLA